MSEYNSIDLFGGAIVASLPANFGDVSDIRQVPDNQELHLDKDGFTNIVIEILERVDASSDHDALRLHFEDVVGDDDRAKVEIWSETVGIAAKLPTGTPVRTLIAAAPPGEKQRGRANEPDFVGISLTLIRLVEQETDLLVSVNVPHVHGQYRREDVDMTTNRLGPLLERAVEYRDRILQTLEIRDWGLFVPE